MGEGERARLGATAGTSHTASTVAAAAVAAATVALPSPSSGPVSPANAQTPLPLVEWEDACGSNDGQLPDAPALYSHGTLRFRNSRAERSFWASREEALVRGDRRIAVPHVVVHLALFLKLAQVSEHSAPTRHR